MKTLTIFDLDETLVDGDTSVTVRRFLQDIGVITDPNYSLRDNALMQQYADGTLNLKAYLCFSLSPLSNIPSTQVDAWIQQCVNERVLPQVFIEAKCLLEALTAQNDGEDVLIISATVSFIVDVVAKALGVKHAIGVDVAIEDNAYTPHIVGEPSFREGKVVRLKQWLATQKVKYDKITFYTDSINDLPMCEFIDSLHADAITDANSNGRGVFVVNPCPKLKPIAEQRGWPILHWQTTAQ